MYSLVLGLGVTVVFTLTYFLLLGLFKLLQALMKHSSSALKSIFIILWIIGMSWIAINHENSEQTINDLKHKITGETSYDRPVINR